MQFDQTELEGAWLISPDCIEDERGFFARAWCENEFAAHGLNAQLVQCNISYNRAAGTLRGLHWQADPHGEVKLVRCTSGVIYDVIVDVRQQSSTFGQWRGFYLSAANRNMLYIPEGFAHGFVTLQDDTEVFYQMSALYVADMARGLHWADADLGIVWPCPVSIVSDRDSALPLFGQVFPSQARNAKVA